MIPDGLCRYLFVAVLLLSACASDEELRSNVSFEDAIKTVVALNDSGISAEMPRTKAGQEPRYSVIVSRANSAAARKVINEYNLFPKGADSFEALTTSDSFVPNARETVQLRLDRALAVEVEHAIGALDGIVDVRAIVRSHLAEAVDRNAGSNPPSASVLIRYTSKSGTQPFSSEDVVAIVSRAVPGLPKENITLSATRVFLAGEVGLDSSAIGTDAKGNYVPLVRVNPFPFMVPAADQVRVRNILSALLGSFALAGLLVGWLLSRSKRPKAPPPKALRTAMLEASFKGPGDSTTPVPSKRAAPSGGPKGN